MPRKKQPTASHGFGAYDISINNIINIVCDGYHNAFADMCKWKGDYYIAYRRAQWHDPIPPGDVVILKSPDAHNWKEVAIIDTGGDDRDPKFIADNWDDVLYCYWGTYYSRWEGKTLSNDTRDLLTCMSQTRNGTVWSTPAQVYRPNYWLWSTAFGDSGYTYGMAYHFGRDLTNSLQLIYKSKKRFALWQTVCTAFNSTYKYTDLSEPALFSMLDGSFLCVVRTSDVTLIGKAHHPYTEWEWSEQDIICHCPVITRVNKRIYVAGRTRLDCIPTKFLSNAEDEKAKALCEYRVSKIDWDDTYTYEKATEVDRKYKHKPKGWLDDVYKCVLWEYDPKKTRLEYRLTLPSGRDCAYPGMVYDEDADELVMCYYSQHSQEDVKSGIPRPADIYVARLKFDEKDKGNGSKAK